MHNRPPDPDIKHFNRWASTYEQSFLQWLLFGPVHAQILALLAQEGPKQPGCIVDVGCGTGRLLRAATVQWPQAQFIGVDPAAQMLAQARRLNPGAWFELAQAESLPLADQSADIVLSSISFHHWVDHQRGVQEVARVLRPDGLFCLADHVLLSARLLGERVQSPRQIRTYVLGAHLALRRQKRLWQQCVLITLAQKPTAA